MLLSAITEAQILNNSASNHGNKFEQLGTRSDPQYKVAETTLSKQISAAATGVIKAKTYNPASSNLPAALGAGEE